MVCRLLSDYLLVITWDVRQKKSFVTLPSPFNIVFPNCQLVMVGDPAQLPATVLSLTAKEHDYHQSLFKRFFKIFASDIGPDGKVQDPKPWTK